jgi:hypothetical protein
MLNFVIGEVVQPRPLWIGNPNNIPTGRVRASVKWGGTYAIYVEGDHRAFVSEVFELCPPLEGVNHADR